MLEQNRERRETYRNHAAGCLDDYDHPGGCRTQWTPVAVPAQYYSRVSYLASQRHARRPVHIHQPDSEQPYSADWLMWCGAEINYNRLVTQERVFAARDWADVPVCRGCAKRAPESAQLTKEV